MKDWNVVVTLRGRQFGRSVNLLRRFGEVASSGFFNVLLMRVDDAEAFLEHLRTRADEEAELLSLVARVMPVTQTFVFQNREEFEAHAKEAVQGFVPALAGKAFHVRVHRRGFKGRLSSLEEEHVLDDVLLERLQETGAPGHLAFDDPDAVVDVETVGTQAGLSIWTRQDITRHPLLHPD